MSNKCKCCDLYVVPIGCIAENQYELQTQCMLLNIPLLDEPTPPTTIKLKNISNPPVS